MHISEGVLSGPVLAAGAAIAVAGTAIGLKKIEYDRIVHVAILASAFFVASLIHVNVGPASAHLILNGIVGLLLGFAAFPAILTALVLQSVFFQYGGLTALGVNVVVMAVPAVFSHYLFLPLIGKSSTLTFTAGFLSGLLSILFSSLLLGAALWFTDKNFFETSLVIIMANIPIMIIEGIVTGFCVTFFLKVYPEIIPKKKL
ncbi:MAG: cobalt transporter CbiM [Proteobacteria bacterium]|nr:cobalt transporter CbiM [Pseudomonadota bacterium]MBU1585889.1 cobalt transporter CbiM [Pseudomonadota bacterium]MBU2453728.1 cobalt transporter CbiM [Pseudomonadota bacterium]MBU2627954.1 cobalt transporter CbiM [Pseudomonadota bacterium]